MIWTLLSPLLLLGTVVRFIAEEIFKQQDVRWFLLLKEQSKADVNA